MAPKQTILVEIPDGEGAYNASDVETELTEATSNGFEIVGVVPAHGHRPALVLLCGEPPPLVVDPPGPVPVPGVPVP